jgi:hypothetical protein
MPKLTIVWQVKKCTLIHREPSAPILVSPFLTLKMETPDSSETLNTIHGVIIAITRAFTMSIISISARTTIFPIKLALHEHTATSSTQAYCEDGGSTCSTVAVNSSGPWRRQLRTEVHETRVPGRRGVQTAYDGPKHRCVLGTEVLHIIHLAPRIMR